MPADGASILLCDFGATHVRVATGGRDGAQGLKVYRGREWRGLDEILRAYAAQSGFKLAGARLYLAHTGHVEGGALHVSGGGSRPRVLRLDDMREALALASLTPFNDLCATARGVLLEGEGLYRRFGGAPGTDDGRGLRAVIGIGTGAGHAFCDPASGQVRETYGGHFPALAVDEIQRAVLAHVTQALAGRTPIAEDILSGRGIHAIYTVLAAREGRALRAQTVQELLAPEADEPLAAPACSVFSGFLGLYAHTLCVVAHAYGGVYLAGGVIERLARAGRFDEAAFSAAFSQDRVPVVASSLARAPLYIASREETVLESLALCAGKERR